MTEEEAEILKVLEFFPKLANDDWRKTSEKEIRYNCFAWAGGDNSNRWEPSKDGTGHCLWFNGDNSPLVNNFIDNYGYVQYKEIADSPDYEDGIEKIAFYVNEYGTCEHAARQKENGFWTSKLGYGIDIEHKTLESLEGEFYGYVKVILKRPRLNMEQKNATNAETPAEFENFRNLTKNLVNVPKSEIKSDKIINKTKNQGKKKSE